MDDLQNLIENLNLIAQSGPLVSPTVLNFDLTHFPLFSHRFESPLNNQEREALKQIEIDIFHHAKSLLERNGFNSVYPSDKKESKPKTSKKKKRNEKEEDEVKPVAKNHRTLSAEEFESFFLGMRNLCDPKEPRIAAPFVNECEPESLISNDTLTYQLMSSLTYIIQMMISRVKSRQGHSSARKKIEDVETEDFYSVFSDPKFLVVDPNALEELLNRIHPQFISLTKVTKQNKKVIPEAFQVIPSSKLALLIFLCIIVKLATWPHMLIQSVTAIPNSHQEELKTFVPLPEPLFERGQTSLSMYKAIKQMLCAYTMEFLVKTNLDFPFSQFIPAGGGVFSFEKSQFKLDIRKLSTVIFPPLMTIYFYYILWRPPGETSRMNIVNSQQMFVGNAGKTTMLLNQLRGLAERDHSYHMIPHWLKTEYLDLSVHLCSLHVMIQASFSQHLTSFARAISSPFPPEFYTAPVSFYLYQDVSNLLSWLLLFINVPSLFSTLACLVDPQDDQKTRPRELIEQMNLETSPNSNTFSDVTNISLKLITQSTQELLAYFQTNANWDLSISYMLNCFSSIQEEYARFIFSEGRIEDVLFCPNLRIHLIDYSRIFPFFESKTEQLPFQDAISMGDNEIRVTVFGALAEMPHLWVHQGDQTFQLPVRKQARTLELQFSSWIDPLIITAVSPFTPDAAQFRPDSLASEQNDYLALLSVARFTTTLKCAIPFDGKNLFQFIDSYLNTRKTDLTKRHEQNAFLFSSESNWITDLVRVPPKCILFSAINSAILSSGFSLLQARLLERTLFPLDSSLPSLDTNIFQTVLRAISSHGTNQVIIPEYPEFLQLFQRVRSQYGSFPFDNLCCQVFCWNYATKVLSCTGVTSDLWFQFDQEFEPPDSIVLSDGLFCLSIQGHKLFFTPERTSFSCRWKLIPRTETFFAISQSIDDQQSFYLIYDPFAQSLGLKKDYSTNFKSYANFTFQNCPPERLVFGSKFWRLLLWNKTVIHFPYDLRLTEEMISMLPLMRLKSVQSLAPPNFQNHLIQVSSPFDASKFEERLAFSQYLSYAQMQMGKSIILSFFWREYFESDPKKRYQMALDTGWISTGTLTWTKPSDYIQTSFPIPPSPSSESEPFVFVTEASSIGSWLVTPKLERAVIDQKFGLVFTVHTNPQKNYPEALKWSHSKPYSVSSRCSMDKSSSDNCVCLQLETDINQSCFKNYGSCSWNKTTFKTSRSAKATDHRLPPFLSDLTIVEATFLDGFSVLDGVLNPLQTTFSILIVNWICSTMALFPKVIPWLVFPLGDVVHFGFNPASIVSVLRNQFEFALVVPHDIEIFNFVGPNHKPPEYFLKSFKKLLYKDGQYEIIDQWISRPDNKIDNARWSQGFLLRPMPLQKELTLMIQSIIGSIVKIPPLTPIGSIDLTKILKIQQKDKPTTTRSSPSAHSVPSNASSATLNQDKGLNGMTFV